MKSSTLNNSVAGETEAMSREKLSLPPGPRDVLGLGSLREVSRDPLGFHTRLAQEYGDIAHYKTLLIDVVFVNSPDGVRHVLQENNKNYNKQNFDYKMIKPLSGEGLLTSDGSFWLRQRRMIQPIFNRRRIASFGEMMVAETRAMLEERWKKYAESGEVFNLAEEMMELTLLIVGRTLFSMDLSKEAAEIGEAFTVASRRLGKIDLYTFLPTWIPVGPNRAYRKALKTLDRTVYNMIEKRRRELQTSPEDAPADLLTLLLQARDEDTNEAMDDKQIRDEVVTLMVAGHETTALALSWTWYLLGQHSEVLERLQREVDEVLEGRPATVEDLSKLPYVQQVIEESMRLYPPAWLTSRNTVEEDDIDGYRVPKGAVVLVSPYTMHRNPKYWSEPEQFRPERFAPEHDKERPKFAYYPFGGGPRLCIGKHMAMMEAQLILATIAQNVQVTLDPSFDVELEPLITLRPKNGIHVTVKPRSEV